MDVLQTSPLVAMLSTFAHDRDWRTLLRVYKHWMALKRHLTALCQSALIYFNRA
jgi:hypothetical protein